MISLQSAWPARLAGHSISSECTLTLSPRVMLDDGCVVWLLCGLSKENTMSEPAQLVQRMTINSDSKQTLILEGQKYMRHDADGDQRCFA